LTACEVVVVDDSVKVGPGEPPVDGEDGGTSECGDEETQCGGECVDLGSDPAHCGECGRMCETGDCIAGGCQPEGECGGEHEQLCEGTCVDTWTDGNHCGGCGRTCPDGPCVEGECTNDGPGCPYTLCGDTCASPYHHDHCGFGEASCGASCESGERCDGNECVPSDYHFVFDPLVGGSFLNGPSSTVACPATLTPAVAAVACRQHGLRGGTLRDGDGALLALSSRAVRITCTGAESAVGRCDVEPYPSCPDGPPFARIHCEE
jgi:hypothetical protein